MVLPELDELFGEIADIFEDVVLLLIGVVVPLEEFLGEMFLVDGGVDLVMLLGECLMLVVLELTFSKPPSLFTNF